MEIRREEVGDVTVLAFEGELDIWNLPETREAVDDLIKHGARKLVLNMNGLTFVTSSALGYLIKTHRRLEDHGGELVVSRPSTLFHTTIETLGIDKLIKVFPADDEAVAHLGRGG